jgi:hypothetical protein
VLNYWKVGARRAKLGLVDAWDIPLAEAMLRLRKKSLVSPINLVRNIGFSERASNTNQNHFPLDLPIDLRASNYEFDTALAAQPLRGEEINELYERDVYGISARNSLTSIFSIFDFVRFRRKNRESLAIRLNRLSRNKYEII